MKDEVKPIRFYEAHDYSIGLYTEGILEPVISRILKTIDGIEQVFSGIQKVMGASNLAEQFRPIGLTLAEDEPVVDAG